MKRTREILFGFVAASLLMGPAAIGQTVTRKAPTAADWASLAKLPDFTGVWEVGLGGGGGGRAGAGRGAVAPDAAAGGRGDAAAKGGRAGAAAGGGRAGRGGGPSLTPAYAAKVRPANPVEDAQAANCLPPGLPAIMNQPYPMEILLTPGKVTIVIEAYTQVRHIYTDGRPLPEDPDPLFYGTSVGHWEDDTLVVETVGLAQVPRGLTFPYSEKLKVVERFRLTGPDTMSIETTLIDPEAFTAPYSMGTRNLARHRTWTIAEYICEENNRNFVDDKGSAGVKLNNPLSSAK
jgi:hypothetical protein